MPTISTFGDTRVRRRVTSQPRAQGTSAAAFSNPLAQGVANIARSAAGIKQRIDTTSAEEALVSFERDKNELFFNPDNGYFNTQGRNAYDGSPVATKSLDDLKTKYGETLTANSKFLFDKSADQHIARSQSDINKHASRGLQTWELATIESQVENSVENASLFWNDPDRLKVSRINGEQSILDSAEISGVGPQATAEKLQTFRSSFARSAVNAATRSSSFAGQEALDQYGEQLEPADKVKIENNILRKAEVEKTQSDAKAAVLTATRLVSQYDDRKDINEQIEQIEDDGLRKKTQSEADAQFGRKKQAESEFRGSSYEGAEDAILQGGSAESFKAGNPEAWQSLSEKQKRKLESGILADTDWVSFSDLLLLPKNQLAKIDPVDHFDRLAKGERTKLISAVKTAKGVGSERDKNDYQIGRTRNAQTTASIDQLFGKKQKRNKDEQRQVDGFYSLLDDEVNFRESEKGGKLSSDEYTNLLSGLTREVVEEGFFFDSETDLSDVPVDDVPVLTEFLRTNNIPVTSDNLIKAFKQASK